MFGVAVPYRASPRSIGVIAQGETSVKAVTTYKIVENSMFNRLGIRLPHSKEAISKWCGSHHGIYRICIFRKHPMYINTKKERNGGGGGILTL